MADLGTRGAYDGTLIANTIYSQINHKLQDCECVHERKETFHVLFNGTLELQAPTSSPSHAQEKPWRSR